MKLWKYSGHYLIGTGVIHNTLGFVLGAGTLLEILQAGLWNTVHPPLWQREAIFWFLMTGFAWMLIGYDMLVRIRETGRPPGTVHGFFLLGMGIIACVLMPASGGWLFLPQAVIVLSARRTALGEK